MISKRRNPVLTGGCQCGAVRFRASSLGRPSLCHCRMCQKAFGGVGKVAGKADLNATSLYRALGPGGNPELKSLRAILDAMGLKLSVQPIKPARGKGGARKAA